MRKILKRVLLIDDNEADNFIHKIFIQKHGGVEETVAVTSGQKALDYLSSNQTGSYPRPELIFLDINMPRMNGWEFLEEYKKLDDEQKGGVVVVMLTTSLNPDDKKMADGDGNVTEFMNKPLNIEKFQSVLERYFPDRLD